MQTPKKVKEKFCKFGVCAATNRNFLSSHSSTDEDRADWNNVVLPDKLKTKTTTSSKQKTRPTLLVEKEVQILCVMGHRNSCHSIGLLSFQLVIAVNDEYK